MSCKKYKAVLIKSEWNDPNIGTLIHEDVNALLSLVLHNTLFENNHMVS